MSERLSSVEIEDVLSSIRRLVSEDLRPGAKPGESAATAPSAPAAAPVAAPPVAEVGKLVLTPALRIQPDPVAEAATDAVGTAGFASIRGRAAAAPSYEEDAEVPEAPATGGHDWFDFADPAAPTSAEQAEVAAPMAEMVEPLPEAEEVMGWSAPPMPEPELDEVDAAVGSVLPVDASEAMTEPEDVLSGPAVQVEGADWLPEDEPAAFAAEPAEEAAMPDMQEPEAVLAAPADAAPVNTAPEADEDWADAAEAEIRRELEAEAEASVFTRFDATEEIGAAGEPVFDEEMLRDLVRDIIREELQGALGERITRNVRKLVRAEIARALAVRDFE